MSKRKNKGREHRHVYRPGSRGCGRPKLKGRRVRGFCEVARKIVFGRTTESDINTIGRGRMGSPQDELAPRPVFMSKCDCRGCKNIYRLVITPNIPMAQTQEIRSKRLIAA